VEFYVTFVVCATGCKTCQTSSLCLSCSDRYAPQTVSPPYACGGAFIQILVVYFVHLRNWKTLGCCSE